MDRTPRDGEMFPKQRITLFDLSRAMVVLRLGAEPSRMWTTVKGRYERGATLTVRADVRAATLTLQREYSEVNPVNPDE